ncbi:hypothetical protein BN903_34 [Halorubrum sp. AJ67]|nr:hypothetical protein BN903_34 [Halorubrum sp. AJ67]
MGTIWSYRSGWTLTCYFIRVVWLSRSSLIRRMDPHRCSHWSRTWARCVTGRRVQLSRLIVTGDSQ